MLFAAEPCSGCEFASSCDTSSAFFKTFGIPGLIRDAKGNKARYVTDTYGRVRQIEAFGFNEDENALEKYASLKYTYGKTLLYEIQRTTGTDVQKYHFLYDNFGNTTSIGIGGWNSEEQITLASYEYAAMNGLLTKQTYGNGDKVEFTYDILGRAKTTTYKDENNNVDRVLTYVYTGDGQLYSIHDSRTGFLYLYTYDSIGRLIGSSVKNSDGEVLMSTRQEYNANNQLVGQHWTVGGTTYSETYTYDTTDGALTSYNNALGQTINLEYDALRRISKVDTTTLDRFYEYADGKESSQTTGLVSRYWYHTASYDDAYYKYSYSYDAQGNISSYTQSGTTYTYTYDDQNQLKTQTGGGKTYTYTYDNAGNILTASNGTTTNSYTYGNALWRDLLTAYNGNYIAYEGQTVSNGVVTGDVIGGNPISYYNGRRYTFTWEEGRNLVSAVEGTNTYTYAYDSNGLRVSKTVNGVKHEYLYASGRLLRETYGDVILDFVYDHNGHPFAMRYTTDGTTTNYYYITNLQGDVLAMITGSGTVVASYSYDPYGKVISATKEMANINPLRYRGYYYDVETGFYYLQSRYYDPAICRFINADSYASTGQDVVGFNMFAYCNNCPIPFSDHTGCFIDIALFFLYHWLFGEGEDLSFDDTSRFVKVFKKTSLYNDLLEEAVSEFRQTGKTHFDGLGEFTLEDSGANLYFSTQHFYYTIDISTEVTTENRLVGFLIMEVSVTRSYATITISDTYDFDYKDWSSFGNTLNNLAFFYHGILRGGTDYDWKATFEVKLNDSASL